MEMQKDGKGEMNGGKKECGTGEKKEIKNQEKQR